MGDDYEVAAGWPQDPGIVYPEGQCEPAYMFWQRAYSVTVHDHHGYSPSGPDYRDTDFYRLLPHEGEVQEDLDKLVYTMGALAIGAESVDLPQLCYGLKGYQAVTAACVKRIGEFEDGPKIEATMPVFFDELASALRLHSEGYRDHVGGWSVPFYDGRARQAKPSVAMLDFLTAHVRYDLPRALLRTRTQQWHYDDYTAVVNGILRDVAEDITGHYVDVTQPWQALGAGKLGTALALRELFAARDEAWRSHRALMFAHSADGYNAINQDMARRASRRMASANPVVRFMTARVTRTPQTGFFKTAEIY